MPATPKLPYCWVEGDLLPEIVLTYVDQDLAGFTITLHLRQKDGTVIVIPSTALDLAQGKFKFEWSDGDLTEGLNQEIEVKFVNVAGEPLTSAKVLIDVRKDLA